MPDSKEYSKIEKKIRIKKGFFIHFGVYVIVNLFLFLINAMTFHYDWWCLFPLVSWGTGVAIHGLAVFGFSSIGIFGEDWKNKQIEKEMYKRGYTRHQKQLPASTELDINQHLDLKEIEKKRNYDEKDLV